MTHRSRPLVALLTAALASLLAACAAPNAAPDSQAAAQAPAASGGGAESLTGSRLPRKSTDRLLRQTGAAGAAEMERERPPNPGPRVQ
jgi:hypothetical protein